MDTYLRMFRADADRRLELVMTGKVSRSNEVLERVASIAARVRRCGFRFARAEGSLESMAPLGNS